MQKLQLQRERRRSYLAVAHLGDGRVVQLGAPDVPEVTVGVHGTADIALGTSELPYRQMISWDSPDYRDVYLVDVRTGDRELILERTQARPTVSPEGRYLTWYDNVTEEWLARNIESGRTVTLTDGIPYPLYDEQHDTPSPPRAYGSAGWTTGDQLFLINDRYDIWATDPTGRTAPRRITEGRGRDERVTFRFIELDADADAIDPSAPLLLSAFHRDTKDAGFYRDRVAGGEEPQRLLFMARRFGRPRKADDADVLVFTRSSVEEFPNLWVSDLDFRRPRKVSDANPQQHEYRWATVELVEWLSADGTPLQGLLYKPEGFDATRKYPLMVNFYERDSDNLHVHHPPIPHRSVVRPTFYASRGYVVFMPDVVYEIGYPGESALDAVVPGVLHLIDQGFIDEDRIGVQGHSWGGYQIAYLVTKTNLFRAAAAGAVVSNMTSAYGGIRWGSGMSRMFQYERTQSRIGATLWEAPMRYIENSPLFWADKVETPLLMMHNDADGAVPWYQGIEYFVALRRLNKPVWMVNYNDEPHWPVTYHEKRDWNIRMQQFFDHFLKDAPAPIWLERGIPATEKGRTLGLELVGER
jgi:acetyl esterase/lipase